MIMIVYPVPDARNAYHPSPSPSSQEKKVKTSGTKSNNCLFEVKVAYIFYFLLILSQSVV